MNRLLFPSPYHNKSKRKDKEKGNINEFKPMRNKKHSHTNKPKNPQINSTPTFSKHPQNQSYLKIKKTSTSLKITKKNSKTKSNRKLNSNIHKIPNSIIKIKGIIKQIHFFSLFNPHSNNKS
jgi:hypothetical protein